MHVRMKFSHNLHIANYGDHRLIIIYFMKRYARLITCTNIQLNSNCFSMDK